jgi:hypothetical protein
LTFTIVTLARCVNLHEHDHEEVAAGGERNLRRGE